MKQYLHWVGLFFLLLGPCFATAQYHYVITGKIDNSILGDAHSFSLKNGDTVTLQFINTTDVCKAVIKEGSFTFENRIDTPSIAMINIYGAGGLILLDNSRYVCSFVQKKFSNNKVGYDVVITTESPFYNLWKSLSQRKAVLLGKQEELMTLVRGSGPGYELNRYEEELSVVRKALSDLYYTASVTHRGSYEMTYLLPAAPDFSYDRYSSFYHELPDSVRNSFYGRNLYNRLMDKKNK